MSRIYATVLDLPLAVRNAPFAEDLIPLASALVTSAIANQRFTTDENGMPVGDDLDACREATVVQVSTWLSTGVHPLSGGLAAKKRVTTSRSTNGSSESFAQDMAQDAYLNMLAAGVRLTDAALAILSAAGLLGVYLQPGVGRGRPFTGSPMFVGGE